jgi:uncharacterized protein YecT (DUF1311 family)
MKLPILIFAFVARIAPIAEAQSQGEMNRQAAASFEKADRELNKLCQKLVADLADQSKAKLKAARRAWVTFRDAEAEFQMDAEARGGSMAAMIYEGTRARMTKARIASLREFFATRAER